MINQMNATEGWLWGVQKSEKKMGLWRAARLNSVMKNEIYRMLRENKDVFSRLDGKTVLITGATGLIGYNLVASIMLYGMKGTNPPKVIALVRNIKKARKMYQDFNEEYLKFIVWEAAEKMDVSETVDYIVHAASQTSSKAFIERPTETIFTAVDGTRNILELARRKKVKSLLYLSSMEAYGTPKSDEKIRENHPAEMDSMSVRSSYPESKRMCEALCSAYWAEYGVPAKVIRLTQTFGPGVAYDDSRVFAEFARCAVEGRDIVLYTRGETKRNYLYTMDAVTAIFTVLLSGELGEAYNAANENTYCSIYEMAEVVAKECGQGQIKVQVQEDGSQSFGYAPILHMNLDAGKLRKLGWKAQTSLPEMYHFLCAYMVENAAVAATWEEKREGKCE